MNPDSELRRRARQATAAGNLPARLPVRTWAGRGGGARCLVCSSPLNAHEVELELEFEASAIPCSPDSSRMHAHCFEAWKLEAEATID